MSGGHNSRVSGFQKQRCNNWGTLISSVDVNSLDNVDGENAEEVWDQNQEEELLRPLLLVDVQDGGGLLVLLHPGHRVVIVVTPQAVRVTRPKQKYL